MSQQRFDWEVPVKPSAPVRPKVVFDPQTTGALLALMARVLLVVSLAAQENADDR